MVSSSNTSDSSIAANISNIPPLTGNNFSTWKERIEIVLGCMDLDYAMRVNAPVPPEKEKAKEKYDELKKAYDEESKIWERSNRLSLMIMKGTISDAIRGAMPDDKDAKSYLKKVEEQFKGSSKANASALIQKLISTKYKYNGNGGIREHILKMSDMSAKLKALEMSIPDEFLVHFIMTSLPSEYTSFKVNYNTQKEKWTMNDLIAHCVQEEERLKAEGRDYVNHVGNNNKRKAHGDNSKGKKKTNVGSPSKGHNNGPKQQKSTPPTNERKVVSPTTCKFCEEEGHFQKDCVEFLKWLSKKGIPYRENPKRR